MKKFFTSDLHFFHRNVITYCDRPYVDVVEMFNKIKEQWNSQVKSGDLVYVLGDFSLNPKYAMAEYLSQFNGDKILIAGNHDACWPVTSDREKIQRQVNKYLNAGWKSLHKTLMIELKDGRNVLMSHLPYANKESLLIDTRYLDHRPKDEGMVLLHGHAHARYRKQGRMIDVGFDGDLKLYSEDDIIKLINDEREYIETPISNHYLTRVEDRKNMKG